MNENENGKSLKIAGAMIKDGDFGGAERSLGVFGSDCENASVYVAKMMINCQARNMGELVRCGYDLRGNLNFQKALRFSSPEQRAKLEKIAEAALADAIGTEQPAVSAVSEVAANPAPPPNYGAPPPNYGTPPPNYGTPPPNYGAPPQNYGTPPPNCGAPPPNCGTPPPTDYAAALAENNKGVIGWWLQGWKDLFNSKARRYRRLKYWSFIAVNAAVTFAFMTWAMVILGINGGSSKSVAFIIFSILAAIVMLAHSVGYCAALKKRMNDTFKEKTMFEGKSFFGNGVKAFRNFWIAEIGCVIILLLYFLIAKTGASETLTAVISIPVIPFGIMGTAASIEMFILSLFESNPNTTRYGECPNKYNIKSTKSWQTVTALVLAFISPIILSVAAAVIVPMYTAYKKVSEPPATDSGYGYYSDGGYGYNGADSGEIPYYTEEETTAATELPKPDLTPDEAWLYLRQKWYTYYETLTFRTRNGDKEYVFRPVKRDSKPATETKARGGKITDIEVSDNGDIVLSVHNDSGAYADNPYDDKIYITINDDTEYGYIHVKYGEFEASFFKQDNTK